MRKTKTLSLIGLSLLASGGIGIAALTVIMIAQGDTIPWNQRAALLFAVLGTCNSGYRMMQSR